MGNGTMDRVIFNVAAQTILRILIASYFLAVALNIIPGTDLGLLFSSILPQTYAAATAAGFVFIFSFMIMIGMATRVAALMLAIMTFFASYLTMIELGVADELGAFWRDIALIAALLLTYSDSASDRKLRRRLFQKVIQPRRVTMTSAARIVARAETTTVPRPRSLRQGARARAEAGSAYERTPAPETPEAPTFITVRNVRPTQTAPAPVAEQVVENIFAIDDGIPVT